MARLLLIVFVAILACAIPGSSDHIEGCPKSCDSHPTTHYEICAGDGKDHHQVFHSHCELKQFQCSHPELDFHEIIGRECFEKAA